LNSTRLAKNIAEFAWQKKGNDIQILDVRKLTNITDYFVIITGESHPHVKAVCDHLLDKLSKKKIRVWHKEGYNNLNWVLLDFIEVVVHIFREETRRYYEFEKLWADANITRVKEDAENRIVFKE
jgi:ribosome-associated protein